MIPALMEPGARRTDPRTSKLAAREAKALAERHHHLILECLRLYGPMGKDGIASHLHGIDGVAVCRRLTELERAGHIEPTGRTVTSMAGRQERQWRLA